MAWLASFNKNNNINLATNGGRIDWVELLDSGKKEEE